jgi:small subunit ribosomal protein S17
MPKRILTGKVTSNKSDKTITVLVERKIMHPMYKKFVTKSKKFSVHDIENKFNIGDIVSIRECNPISKNKRFEVIY